MPFIVDEEGVVSWTPPTDEDVQDVQKSISTPARQSGVDEGLTRAVREKISEAVNAVMPTKKWGIIVDSNKRVYQTIKALSSGTRGLVDIIIPIHNSIHITKQCVEAVLERTNWPFHIYLMDDASDEHTNDELHRLQKANKSNITVITSTKNRGFAATVNSGIKESNGEFICLLNSDVLVTDLWLTKMMMAHKADPKNQIVCPATNNTAIVGVPLSPGASYLQMNRIFEQFAIRRYPEIMPTGFCFFFPRSLTDKIGLLDEGFENFGEESDFWMKAVHYTDGPIYPKYRAVMADDAYVFHERGTSFAQLGDASHMHLRKLASGRFNQIWPQFQSWQKTFSVKKALGHLKDNVPAQLVGQEGDYHICWVVHSATMCGGMRYIADIVNEINERGGNARVALIKRKASSDENFIGELRTAPIVFQDYDEFAETFTTKVFDKGVLVAATAELVGVVKRVCDEVPTLRPLLHTQSYEPDLLPPDTTPEVAEMVKSAFQAVPNVISNSRWITKILKRELKVKPFITVSPGVDRDLFYPRDRSKGDERPTVMIPMIQNYACKGFDRGVALIYDLERTAEKLGLDIRILCYGTLAIPLVTRAVCLGPLSQSRLATMLGTEVDVFIDPSTMHSYGMPALEAVASGVAVVSWDNKGIKEYLDPKRSPIYDNSEDTEIVAQKIISLLFDKDKRKVLVRNGNKKLERHDRRKSVTAFIDAVEKHFNLSIIKRRIVMVVPHMRKHGGPTTLIEIANELAKHGHDVSITTVYTDINPEVASMTDLDINIDAQNIPACDLLITNSDNPMCEGLCNLKQAKKKIMLKLSHNPRFKILEEQGLNCKWDAVVTSTEWLKHACENPTEGWDYKPVKTHRIGWWHYGHEIMSQNIEECVHGEGTEQSPFTIGFLVHAHPSKGTQDIVGVLGTIFRETTDAIVRFVGVGEIPPDKFGLNLPGCKYKYSPHRTDMASIMDGIDIWIGASHTEGLGRMALEAMSAGAACILSDTGAEYAKHEENCLLFPIGDGNSMIAAVRAVMSDKKLREKIRTNGFDTAAKLSNPEPCLDNFEQVIREVFND